MAFTLTGFDGKVAVVSGAACGASSQVDGLSQLTV